MEAYEAVIIGAGPGGLNCAKILGDAGKKVLLLEQNSEIGPKVCAGGLTRKSYKYLNLPEELINRKFNKILFNAPRIKTVVRFPEPYFFTIDRKKLGEHQVKKINRDFVTIRTQARVTKIEKEYIEINGLEKITYKYLVGADGSNSFVRRYLKLETKLLGVAIQYLVPTNKFSEFELFFDSKSFYAWYSWIFPHDSYVSIGYGYPARMLSAKLMAENFKKWLVKHDIDISSAEYQAATINCDYQGFRFGNIFLVGDAAGLASGFTGEGIYQALVSGEEVAKTILDKKYKPGKTKEVLRERKYHHALLRIVAYSGPLRNFVFDFVALCIRNRFLGRTLVRILT